MWDGEARGWLLKVQFQNAFGVNQSQTEPPYRAADRSQPLTEGSSSADGRV